MKSKILLLSVAVMVVGMFAMPETLSLFAGQHTFKNANEVANDTGCRKCHEDIYEEMHNPQNNVHWNIPGAKGTFDVFACTECHSVTNVSTYFSMNVTVKEKAHAATTVPCLSCHSSLKGLRSGANYCMSCHGYTLSPGPDQFPMHALAWKYRVGHVSNHPDGKHCGQCHLDANNPTKDNVYIKLVNSTITGIDEAHKLYYYESKYPDNQTTIRLKDSNTACVGCHTHTLVTNTWVRKGGYKLTADVTSGSWNVSFSINQTNVNTTVSGQ